MESNDVVIVGAGMGRSALAKALSEDAGATVRRAKWGELMATDPRAFMLLVGAFGGPATIPPDSFDDELHAAVRAA
jgi:hypothetical protein